MLIKFTLNNKTVERDLDPDMPLLWAVRDYFGQKGTKFGCGKGICGACTLLIDNNQVRSCSYPVKFAHGKSVITIEGIDTDDKMHPVKVAWIEEVVPQCGYCQPGFIMATVNFLKNNPDPTEEDIKSGITNICRCGTHPRIIRAIKKASKLLQNNKTLS